MINLFQIKKEKKNYSYMIVSYATMSLYFIMFFFKPYCDYLKTLNLYYIILCKAFIISIILFFALECFRSILLYRLNIKSSLNSNEYIILNTRPSRFYEYIYIITLSILSCILFCIFKFKLHYTNLLIIILFLVTIGIFFKLVLNYQRFLFYTNKRILCGSLIQNKKNLSLLYSEIKSLIENYKENIIEIDSNKYLYLYKVPTKIENIEVIKSLDNESNTFLNKMIKFYKRKDIKQF